MACKQRAYTNTMYSLSVDSTTLSRNNTLLQKKHVGVLERPKVMTPVGMTFLITVLQLDTVDGQDPAITSSKTL